MKYSKNLFDRIIDVEFSVDKPEASVVYSDASLIPQEKYSYKCPRTGVKPTIAFFMHVLPGNNQSSITLKLTNFYSEIDMNKYRYMKIRAGYKDVTPVTLSVEIFSCFIEKPNPEGVTVFNGILGYISEWVYNPKAIKVDWQGNKEQTVKGKKVYSIINEKESLFKTIADACGVGIRMNLTSEWGGPVWDTENSMWVTPSKPPLTGRNWSDVFLPFNTLHYTFADALAVRTWLNDLLLQLSFTNGLAPLKVTLDEYMLSIVPTSEADVDTKAIVLDKVSSAYLNGGDVVIKAPWNPLLLPDSQFKMNSNFFRGRIASLKPGGTLTNFQVLEMDVDFSTTGQNEMTVRATDISISGIRESAFT